MPHATESRKQRHKRLRALYEEVPKVKCKGLCAESCGPIGCSDLEREIIEKRAGKVLTTDRNLTCTMLHNGHCSVYGDRPMVCRLWGAVPEMPCPHGCEVETPVAPSRGYELLAKALEIGGGKHVGLDGIRAKVIAMAMRDPKKRQMLDVIVEQGMKHDTRKMGL